MRIGIIVDSSIDLPRSFYEQENITILPVTVKIGEASLADDRNEAAALAFRRIIHESHFEFLPLACESMHSYRKRVVEGFQSNSLRPCHSQTSDRLGRRSPADDLRRVKESHSVAQALR